MPSFKDANSREWLVSIDGPKIKEVRKELGIDLGALDGKAYEAMVDDPVLLVDALWLIVRSQALPKGVTDVSFGESLVGEAIERATAALTDAIEEFMPEKKRVLVRTLAKRNQATRNLAMAEVMANMTDPEMTEKMQTAMRTEIKNRFENLLARFGNATGSQA